MMQPTITLLLTSALLAACTTPRLVPRDGAVDLDATASDAARPDASEIDATIARDAAPDAWMCVAATVACAMQSQCCDGRACESTATSGPERTVCCGGPAEPCTFTDGEDCCGRLVCRTTATSGTARVCCAEPGQACTLSIGCCGTSACRSGVCTAP